MGRPAPVRLVELGPGSGEPGPHLGEAAHPAGQAVTFRIGAGAGTRVGGGGI